MNLDVRLQAAIEALLIQHRGALSFDFAADELFATYREIHEGVSAAEAPRLLARHATTLREPFSVRDWLIHYRKFGALFQCQRIPPPEQLERLVELSNQSLRDDMRRRLYGIDGVEFESMVIRILREQAWVESIEGTKPSHDAGIDFCLRYGGPPFEGLLALGQVKRKMDAVGGPEMREFIGSLQADDRRAARGIYVAYGGFNREATRLAGNNQPNIQLCDIDDIIGWLLEAEIGVRRLEARIYRLEDAFWRELA